MIERWRDADAAAWLRVPTAADDKYRRGVLGMRTGSTAYPGAAVLGVTAAWRTGAGLLRYVPPLGDPASTHGLPSPAAAVLAARPETVFGAPTGPHGCDAWVLGSGTDPQARAVAEHGELLRLLGEGGPVVVDAGALELLLDPGSVVEASSGSRNIPSHAYTGASRRSPVILTPHLGEFTRLWRGSNLGPLPSGWPEAHGTIPDEETRADAALALARELGATVLLKGSVTLVATPGGSVHACGPATPWLATAGTGDVLAGALGALVAAHAAAVREDPELLGPLGATASKLHDLAARIAAADEGDGSGRPITALDVAEALPAAGERLLAAR